jgi:hypothetical protein
MANREWKIGKDLLGMPNWSFPLLTILLPAPAEDKIVDLDCLVISDNL